MNPATIIDETHDPAASCWVPRADGHADFPVQNLPFGIFSPAGRAPRAGVAIGDRILDLAAASAAGLLPDTTAAALSRPVLNDLLGLPGMARRALRRRLFALLTDAGHRSSVLPLLHETEGATLHLPAAIGDYSDFYVGIHHAENVGRQFRPDTPLLPNYRHVPIGYHGRASSIRASGTPVIRPAGQQKPADADAPVFGPSARLDYELELGIWIGRGNALGEPIPITEADDHIAGLCLLNDWSARDLQAWEYQPLGPFLGKSFLSTVSPWIVTMEALAPFRIAQPARAAGDPRPLPYLRDARDQSAGAFSIRLEARISTATMRGTGIAPHRLSRAEASNMYWTAAQIVTHHASNGCNLRAGDLLGTGTISAASPDGHGSLLEIARGGAAPLRLPTGEMRSFLEDGDEIMLSATAHAPGRASIGFGPCRGMIVPPAALP